MYWRGHLAARRIRYRLVRFGTRTSLGRAVRTGLSLALLPLLVVATGWWLGAGHAGRWWEPAVRWWEPVERWGALAGRWWQEAIPGWRELAASLWGSVDAQRGARLMASVLPAHGEPEFEPAPGPSWQRPLRSWVYAATGYDLGSPRSFLEAEIGGFRRSVALSLDVLRLPGGAAGAPDEPRGEAEALSREAPIRQDGDELPYEAARAPAGRAGGEREASPRAGALQTGPGAAQEAQRVPGEPAALPALAARDWGDQPRVLIVHSHTSESYVTDPPDPRADPRHHVFNESDTGITRVGRALAERLQSVYGIGTIHSTRIHNWPNHWDAYVNSRQTVEEILAAYPSIDIVFDVHRQGIENAVWATSVGGVEAVSIEVIYTTSQDFRYASHPNWRRNEAFASVLANAMRRIHPGLLNRVTAVRDRRYNQDLHPHMLLLEIGNYLDREEHAIAAARLLADAVALALYELEQGAVEALVAPRTVTPPQPPRPVPASPPPRR